MERIVHSARTSQTNTRAHIRQLALEGILLVARVAVNENGMGVGVKNIVIRSQRSWFKITHESERILVRFRRRNRVFNSETFAQIRARQIFKRSHKTRECRKELVPQIPVYIRLFINHTIQMEILLTLHQRSVFQEC